MEHLLKDNPPQVPPKDHKRKLSSVAVDAAQIQRPGAYHDAVAATTSPYEFVEVVHKFSTIEPRTAQPATPRVHISALQKKAQKAGKAQKAQLVTPQVVLPQPQQAEIVTPPHVRQDVAVATVKRQKTTTDWPLPISTFNEEALRPKTPLRSSHFVEGSMKDRVSTKPPGMFLSEDDAALEAYHAEKARPAASITKPQNAVFSHQPSHSTSEATTTKTPKAVFTHQSSRSTSESTTTKTPKAVFTHQPSHSISESTTTTDTNTSRSSGVFRFGRALSSIPFNPLSWVSSQTTTAQTTTSQATASRITTKSEENDALSQRIEEGKALYADELKKRKLPSPAELADANALIERKRAEARASYEQQQLKTEAITMAPSNPPPMPVVAPQKPVVKAPTTLPCNAPRIAQLKSKISNLEKKLEQYRRELEEEYAVDENENVPPVPSIPTHLTSEFDDEMF